jgi:hypothetical protein
MLGAARSPRKTIASSCRFVTRSIPSAVAHVPRDRLMMNTCGNRIRELCNIENGLRLVCSIRSSSWSSKSSTIELVITIKIVVAHYRDFSFD